jgi:hypothetical protein
VSAQSERLGVPVVPIPGTRHANRLDENVAALGWCWTTTPSLSCNPSAAWCRAGAAPNAASAEKGDFSPVGYLMV